MARLPALPPSELEVVRIVWDLGEATVREVSDAMPTERNVDFWTVQTYLRRLEAKGYLRKHKLGRNNVYTAAVRPRRIIRQLTEDFVNRLFDGETLPLLQHLIQERGLSRDEMEQLQATLDQLKERRK